MFLINYFPCYIKIKDEQHSKAVQQWLFNQGCIWLSSRTSFVSISPGDYIKVNDIQVISKVVDRNLHIPELVLDFDYTPVLKSVQVILPVVKKETLEINGKTYYKEDVEERLKELKEVN